MSEIAASKPNMKPHFPEIKVNINNQDSLRPERKPDRIYINDGLREAFASSSNLLVPGKTNLIERSLLGPVSGSRLSGRRTHTSAVPPSRINAVGYSNMRSGIASREMERFLPEVVHPSSFASYGKINVEAEQASKNKQVNGRPSRVEAALEIVRKLKELRRENQSLGVPKDFTFADAGCIFVEEDRLIPKRDKLRLKSQRELRKKTALKRGEARLRANANAAQKKIDKELDLKRVKTTIAEIGVKWKPPLEIVASETNRKLKAWEKWGTGKPESRAGSRGTLCKAKYPLAEALTREGTSAEKRRGRTLQQGDWKIMKIWPREAAKIQPNILPIQMANEDIPLLRKIYEMAKCYDNAIDVCSLENDGISTSDSYSDGSLADEERSDEGRTNSDDSDSMNSFNEDGERRFEKSAEVDGNVPEESRQREGDAQTGNTSAVEHKQQTPSAGVDVADKDGAESSGGSSEADRSLKSAEKTDSQIQSENEERARTQRSWLHLASAVLSAESGGT